MSDLTLPHLMPMAAAPVVCPVSALPGVTNGTWPCRTSADSSGNLALNTSCTLACDGGFKVDGATTPTTTCGTSGIWSGPGNLTCGEGWGGVAGGAGRAGRWQQVRLCEGNAAG
jgi:hypothetical protein